MITEGATRTRAKPDVALDRFGIHRRSNSVRLGLAAAAGTAAVILGTVTQPQAGAQGQRRDGRADACIFCDAAYGRRQIVVCPSKQGEITLGRRYLTGLAGGRHGYVAAADTSHIYIYRDVDMIDRVRANRPYLMQWFNSALIYKDENNHTFRYDVRSRRSRRCNQPHTIRVASMFPGRTLSVSSRGNVLSVTLVRGRRRMTRWYLRGTITDLSDSGRSIIYSGGRWLVILLKTRDLRTRLWWLDLGTYRARTVDVDTGEDYIGACGIGNAPCVLLCENHWGARKRGDNGATTLLRRVDLRTGSTRLVKRMAGIAELVGVYPDGSTAILTKWIAEVGPEALQSVRITDGMVGHIADPRAGGDLYVVHCLILRK